MGAVKQHSLTLPWYRHELVHCIGSTKVSSKEKKADFIGFFQLMALKSFQCYIFHQVNKTAFGVCVRVCVHVRVRVCACVRVCVRTCVRVCVLWVHLCLHDFAT